MMTERINTTEHCRSLSQRGLRESCEYLAGQCAEQAQRSVQNFSLRTPDGGWEITNDINGCLDAAKTIPVKQGPFRQFRDECDKRAKFGTEWHNTCSRMLTRCDTVKNWPADLMTEFGVRNFKDRDACVGMAIWAPLYMYGLPEPSMADYPVRAQNQFLLKAGEGYHFLKMNTNDNTVTYNGNFTQLDVGAAFPQDRSRNIEINLSLVLRHSYLKAGKEGFGDLHIFQANAQSGFNYYYPSSTIGLHVFFDLGANFLKTDAFQPMEGVTKKLNFEPGANFDVSFGLSFLNGQLMLLSGYEHIETGVDISTESSNIKYETASSNGLILGIFVDFPELLGMTKERVRKRSEELINSSNL